MKKTILLFVLTVLLVSVVIPPDANAVTPSDYIYIDNGNGTCTITGYTGPSGGVTIPSVIDALVVNQIGDSAFERKGLFSVGIPATVNIIGDSAFDGNPITFVTIPSSVYYIGLDAFNSSYSLPSGTGTWYIKDARNNYLGTSSGGNSVLPSRRYSRYTYPYTVNSDSTATIINYFGSASSITIPETVNALTVTKIGDGAFYYQNLSSVTLPTSVTNIYDGTFERNSFTSFSLPDNNAQWEASNLAQYVSGDTVPVSLGYTLYNYMPNRINPVPSAGTASVHTNTAYSLNLSTIFEDRDLDTMTYEVNIDGAGFVSANGSYLYTPATDGVYTLIFRALDATSTSSDTYEVELTAASQYFTITYDANGGAGGDSETRAGASTDILHDGIGFTMANNIIDGWTIDRDDYMLADLYKMPLNSVTAFAIWALDTDGDGVSDDDEIIAGTNPNDPNDIPQEGAVTITVYNDDSAPYSGATCVLNSTPIFVTSNSNGEATFNNINLSSHVLSIRSGSTLLGQYTLDFTIGASDATAIADDGSTDSQGHIQTTVTEEFMMLDVNVRQNASGFWEITDSSTLTTRDMAENPQTGDVGGLWGKIIFTVILLGSLSAAAVYKVKQNES